MKTTGHLILLVSSGFALRLMLLFLYPAAYGDDCIGRLYLRDELFIGHWLPLTQAFILFGHKAGISVMGIRMIFAFLGSCAAGGVYLLLRVITKENMALFGGFLFSVNTLVVTLSLMPYQDVIFVGFLFAAIALFFQRKPYFRSRWASLFWGLACLTRYESWFVLPLLFIWRLQKEKPHRRLRLSVLAGTAVYFGWAPLFWLGLSHTSLGNWNAFLFKTTSLSFYGWQPHFDLIWITKYVGNMMYWTLRFSSPIVLLAPFGFYLSMKKEAHPVFKLLFPLVGTTLFFFFFIIGRDFFTVNRFVMLPMSLAVVLTVLGLQEVLARFRAKWRIEHERRNRVLLFVTSTLIIVLMALIAKISVERLNANPQFKTPFEVAHFLGERLTAGEKAVVLAERTEDLTDFAPMDYQRIMAQSEFDRTRILSSGLLELQTTSELKRFCTDQHVRYVVQFLDFQPRVKADSLFNYFISDQPARFETVFEAELAKVFKIKDWSNAFGT